MSDYHYPGTTVLRNTFGYTDPDRLAAAESAVTAARAAELARNPVAATFDYEHLQAIHRNLFGDLYEWAGEQRTINTMAGNLGISHDPQKSIPAEAHRIFGELAEGNHLRGREHPEFVQGLAEHWGDMTSLHPFVDGNSRTQRIFFDQLSHEAGWAIDWREVDVNELQAARNFAYVDGGQILADVLAPVVHPVGELDAQPAHAAARTDVTLEQHWHAMLEHYDAKPEQPYISISRKLERPPAAAPEAQQRKPDLPEIDTSRFRTHWTPEHDHHLTTGHTIPQHTSRPEGPRL